MAKAKAKTVKMERDGRVVDAPLCDVENMLVNGWVKV